MLMTFPDILIVVGTSTIGASGMLIVELPIYVIVPFSFDETFDSTKFVITWVCSPDPFIIIIRRFALNRAAAIGLEVLLPSLFPAVDIVVSLNESKLPLQNPKTTHAGWPDSLF